MMAFRRYRPPLIKRAGFRWALRRLRSLNGQGNRPGGEVKYARRPFLPSKPLDGLLVPVLCELGPKTDLITDHKGAERPLIRSDVRSQGCSPVRIGGKGGNVLAHNMWWWHGFRAREVGYGPPSGQRGSEVSEVIASDQPSAWLAFFRS